MTHGDHDARIGESLQQTLDAPAEHRVLAQVGAACAVQVKLTLDAFA